MAVSGKCYLSLHQMNASANRGACLQPCRRAYTVTEQESGDELAIDNQYIMSPKDLKTIHFLNKMIDAGVRVFKIEGRARGPEYVKMVCRTYNEALQAYVDGTYNQAAIDRWDASLSSVFNRGFWNGYYLGQRLGEWSANYGSLATKKKLYIGKGSNYFPKIGVAEFIIETHDLKVGDDVIITGPTTGVVELKVAELRFDLEPVEVVKKGQRFSMAVGVKVRRNDKLFKIVDAKKEGDAGKG
ncbi:collagenase precursor [Geofilum rubicundum JCM 15548]|uniref:Collagenase n=2 Tax=Geofilum TaxID=1236988 RepID=A0A0E9LSN9_9BACT|nr:collagenase precursor [Geofilum rubicundum JCM 15548]